jgi:amino acid transporter
VNTSKYFSYIFLFLAGQFSFISLYLVVLVLYLFRNIYAEVGLALPLNGGAYNVLLNCTTKLIASIAACLTLVSYIATAVVSASSAIAYGQHLWAGLDPAWAVMALLGFFCLLTLFGLKESANVALFIFIVHIGTMSLLLIKCLIKIMGSHDSITLFIDNWRKNPTENVPADIYYGFALALLGVSGFETSSNYIEEQAPGIFPKTLRNMWYVVSLFNPCKFILLQYSQFSFLLCLVFSLVSLFIMPMSEILQHRDDLLAAMGSATLPPNSNQWLAKLISADALLVLSGAVLTSYVGITGLIRRMSYDRCLPMFLSHTNRWRQTNHFIIIGFFIVTSLLHFVVNGKLDSLAGVYSMSFLSVMSLFAVGNMILKYKRGSLRRTIYASWPHVIAGFVLVFIGLTGEIILNLPHIIYFLMYFGTTFLIVMLMFSRNRVLKLLLYFGGPERWKKMLNEQYHSIEDWPMLFFTKTDDPSVINKAILYVRHNELTNSLKICHVYENESDIPSSLESNVKFLDRQYPKMCLDLVSSSSYSIFFLN